MPTRVMQNAPRDPTTFTDRFRAMGWRRFRCASALLILVAGELALKQWADQALTLLVPVRVLDRPDAAYGTEMVRDDPRQVLGYDPPAELDTLRRASAPALTHIPSLDTLARADALRGWTRLQAVGFGPELENASIPQRALPVLHAMRRGLPAQCGPFAFLYQGVLSAHGIPNRLVIFGPGAPFKSPGHAAVEVWVGGRWVLQDPTFDVAWIVNGRRASLWELRSALRRNAGRAAVSPLHGTGAFHPTLEEYPVAYSMMLANVLYAHHAPAWRLTLARLPFLKFLQSQYFAIRDEAATSPWSVNNWIIGVLYVWGPLLIIGVVLRGLHLRQPR